MTRLEFGNPEHVALAAEGALCACNHVQKSHVSGECTVVVDENECFCSRCGNGHVEEIFCECDEFRPKRLR